MTVSDKHKFISTPWSGTEHLMEDSRKVHVNHGRKYLYINIPKNASTSLRSTILFDEYVSYGSFDASEYMKFIVFRNPFDRIISSFMEIRKLRGDGPFEITRSSEWYKEENLLKSFEGFLYFIEDNFYDGHVFPQSAALEHKELSLSDVDEILLFDTLYRDYDSLISRYPQILTRSEKLLHLWTSPPSQGATLRKFIDSSPHIYKHINRIYPKDCEIYTKLYNERN